MSKDRIKQATCGQCQFSDMVLPDGNKDLGNMKTICRLEPPTLMYGMVMQKLPSGEAVPGFNSVSIWKEVRPSYDWCSKLMVKPPPLSI